MRSVGTSAKPMWVATWEAKLPSPRNSSGFMVATTMASGDSRPASASAVRAASVMSAGSDSLRRPIRVIPAPATKTCCMTIYCTKAGRPASSPFRPSAGGAAAAERGRRRGDPELPDEPQEVRALQAERSRRVRAVAGHLLQRGLDQPALEVGGGAQNEGPSREGPGQRSSGARLYDLVAGLTPGLSVKNCLLSSVKLFHWSGTSSSAKIAFTGHTGSHAPQSMHSSGWMYSCVSPS